MKRIALTLGIVLAAAVWATVDPNAGIRSWWEMRAQLRDASLRSDALRGELAKLEAAAQQLQEDPLAVESAIRTDLGLARPGEIIVRAVAAASNP